MGMRVLRLAALAQDDRLKLEGHPHSSVILSKPKARRRIRYPFGEVAGMRVLRRATLAQDDGDRIGFPRFDCHSERTE